MKKALLVTAALLLAACGDEETNNAVIKPTADDIARAENLLPQDKTLAEIYERSCISCHSQVDAEAPLTGHKAAWQALITQKGMDGLVQSARNGFNNMPALGYCNDCSDQDFTALINFMAGEAQ